MVQSATTGNIEFIVLPYVLIYLVGHW